MHLGSNFGKVEIASVFGFWFLERLMDDAYLKRAALCSWGTSFLPSHI